MQAAFLSPREREVFTALAEVATPSGERVGPPDPSRLAAAEAVVAEVGPLAATGFRAMLHALEQGARLGAGRPFSALDPAARASLLSRLDRSDALHLPLYALTAPLKYAAVHAPEVYAKVGVPFGVAPSRARPEPWESQVVDLRTLDRDASLEVDAVVIGSGAGGAPVARKLAAAGLAVLILEEGGYHTRRDFDGHAFPAVRKLYRGGGTLAAYGNAVIPVMAGRTVGGSTTINSGTCFRTPPDVLRAWSDELGLPGLAPDALAPYFDAVERTLEVAPNPMEVLGGNARVVARGAEALGWHHAPLPRNAPGCDGQGLCCFGCPTDAKKSTLVTYLPQALKSGAMLYAGARVDRILTRGGRAEGVIAEAQREDGSIVRLRVAAKAVVVAGGAIPTPLLLLRNGLANSSGQVGRNLSLHPASYGMALFDERIDGFRGVPQGYGVHAFAKDGLMLEGLFVPPDITAASSARLGREWSDLVDRLEHVAAFGFMIRDTSRGRVRGGPGGRPIVTYRLAERDRQLVIRGHARIAELFLAAGAREARPGVSDQPILRSRSDLERFEREAPRRYRARDLGLSAYHPLGTCRMGSDPRRSVVDAHHETHDVRGLYVVDGSVLPGAPGVNPQVTIMALAERAGDSIADRLDARPRPNKARPKLRDASKSPEPRTIIDPTPAAPRPPRRAWIFSEVMAGPLREVREAVTRDLTLTLDVRFVELAHQLRCLWSGGGRLTAELVGTAELGGLAHARPVLGHLTWAPLGGRAALVYELSFPLDDGTTVRARGEKHVLVPRIIRGATELHTILQVEGGPRDGETLAKGLLRFSLWTLPAFLRSFALRTPDLL